MLLNLTVVYFAFGTPLGVYGFIRTEGSSQRAFVASVLRLVLWPLFALVSVHRSLLVQKPAAIDEELAELRTEMESLINAEAGDMTPFRDAFARFTGLARLSVRRDTAELLRIAGRNDLATAAACLERTNRRRIALHKAQAREDLEQILQQHGVPGSFTTRLDEIVRCIGG